MGKAMTTGKKTGASIISNPAGVNESGYQTRAVRGDERARGFAAAAQGLMCSIKRNDIGEISAGRRPEPVRMGSGHCLALAS